MTSVVMPRPVLAPLHATLSRAELHHLMQWYIAWALIVFTVPLSAHDREVEG